MSYNHPYGYSSSGTNLNPPTQSLDSDLMQWFQAVDQDKSGKITSNELRQALVVGNGSHFSMQACELLIKLFSPMDSRMIDFDGFKSLFHYVNQWKIAFQTYDRDHSGSIDQRELGQALLQMGYRLSEQSVQSVLKKFASQPGQITFDSFIIACVQLHQMTNAFRRYDKNQTGTITIGYEDFLQIIMSV